MIEVIPWNGKKITAPGIYSGMDMAFYHGDCCDGPSISSSGLRKIEQESLLHYWDESYLNPDRAPQEESTHFSLGRAAHHLIGGLDGFAKEFSIRPVQWDSWRTKDAKAWRAAEWAAGRTVISPDDIEVIQGLARSLERHPTVRAGILSGLVECAGFVKDPVTGVWLKIKPDFMPLDSTMAVDLKTCASADALSCRRAITDLGYNQQFGLIHDVWQMLTGIELTDHVPLFVEKKRPFAVNLKPIGTASIMLGRLQNRRALNKFAVAVKGGVWEGYEDDEVSCELLPFAIKRLEDDIENGRMPGLLDPPDYPHDDVPEAV